MVLCLCYSFLVFMKSLYCAISLLVIMSSTKKTQLWASYLQADVCQQACSTSRGQCHDALSRQRELIARITKILEPESIACLGSGYLNDIPINVLFEYGKDVALVDWIDGVSQQGVAGSIISKNNGSYNCLFCDKCIGSLYCSNFTNEVLDEGVCSAFVPVEGDTVTCQNYEPGLQPNYIASDVTAGYSSSFAELVENKITKCKTPKEAFVKAIKSCDQVAGKQKTIPLTDNSVDFLTSSMVVSQFDVEPYNFFSLMLERAYGRDRILSLEKTLRPFMEKLRTKLFVDQVKRHVEEMFRLVKKDGKGRIYFSVELFRLNTDGKLYFLVQDMQKTLEIIGHYFLFDFDTLPESDVLHRCDIDDGVSIVQNYMLSPRLNHL